MQKKVLKNAGWIIVCKAVKAVLMLIVTAITARYLGPSKYGLISYAAGLVAFVLPIMQLGLNNTMVHEIVERPEQEGKVVGTSILMSVASAFLCIIGVVSFTLIANKGETDTIIVSAIYSILLVFQAIEFIQYWFQSKLLSKFTAIAMLVAYIAVSIFQIVLVVCGVSVYFFAISYSLDFLIIDIILIIIYNKKSDQKLSFSFSLAKELFSVSKYYIIASLLNAVFHQTDRIMLKLMIGNGETGIYSAAATCAEMLSFIFAAVLDSMRPEIFRNKKENNEKYEKSVTELYSVMIYFSLIVCIVITALAPLIIKVMYGEQYLNSVSVLRLLTWHTVFVYIGSVRNIWILAEGKQKYIWIINLGGALANVILNLVLIPLLGAMGAAIATLITHFVNHIVTGLIIKPLWRNNTLLLNGLNPKNLKGVFGALKNKNDGEDNG